MQLDLLVKDPVVRGGLAVFPVFSTSPAASLYLTGPDADRLRRSRSASTTTTK